MSALKELYEKIPPKGDLQFIYFGLTSSCNLRCFYCYDESIREEEKTRDELSLNEIEGIVDDCQKLNLSLVTITGGEPLVNPNWYEVGKMFNDIGVGVSYSTNGTLLSEENIKKLSEINAGIQISLDGNDEVMEWVTKGKRIYSKTMESIDICKKYGVSVHLNSVVGKHNIDFIDQFIEEIHEKEVRCRFVPYNYELNPKYSEYALTIQEKYELIMKINEYNKKKNTRHIRMTLPPLMTPECIPFSIQPACGWAYNMAGILPNGDVSVCAPASGVSFFRAGNIRDSSFYDIWNNSELLKKLRSYNVSDLKGVCAECPVNEVCAGSCRVAAYLRTGDETSPGSLCQEFYDAVMDGLIDTKTFPIGVVEIEK